MALYFVKRAAADLISPHSFVEVQSNKFLSSITARVTGFGVDEGLSLVSEKLLKLIAKDLCSVSPTLPIVSKFYFKFISHKKIIITKQQNNEICNKCMQFILGRGVVLRRFEGLWKSC